MTTFHCSSAWLPSGIARDVRLVTEAGSITEVQVRVPIEVDDISLGGLVLPGFANAHSHAFHRALRGRTHLAREQTDDFWTWRRLMYGVANRLDPDTYLALARAAFAEMVQSGFTVVGEFHYLHHRPFGRPYPDPNAMSLALIQAAGEAGIRLTLLDTLYLCGGLDASGHKGLDELQRRFSDGSVGAWADRRQGLPESPLVHQGAAVHSVRAVPLAALREVRDLIGKRPLHVHLSEQPDENAAALAHYRRTPTRLLADAGLLSRRLSVVHATHLTDDDLALLADARVTAVFCPTTEADLADGIGPARALADEGVRLAIGSDQHIRVDPFGELQALEDHQRLASGLRNRFTADELVEIGSPNGYASLGWDSGGRLEAGGLADFVAVATGTPRTAGSDPAQLPFTASGAEVTDVVVAGEQVVRGGVHRLGDVGGLLRAALAALR